ncbi:OprD family porin [Pseudomonas mangiferae]|uniref:OprD family porin n=1 Tax=Pseudomonas mangiferae TaxID=2593654 RepID=A0A553GXD0_9PSED|nr:OprD family porin [Pseudomonas mangiferae]TRX74146.1 OprD family porin [Pseudomonas mangiferae]
MRNNHQRHAAPTCARRTLGSFACTLGLAFASSAYAAQEDAKGFIEDSHLNLLNRNFYFYRDLRNGARNNLGANGHKPVSARNGYREEWAQGLMAFYTSGYTQGTVGVGVDAFGMLGVRLDGGGGSTGTSLLPWDGDGHPEREYSKFGGAVKLRFSNTVLKYGQQVPSVPVFASNQVRLLPSTATGFSLVSDEIDGLNLQAGHFTSVTSTDSTNRDGEITTDYTVLPAARAIDYAGGTYRVDERLSFTVYADQLKDIWRQYYGNATYVLPLDAHQSLQFNFNLFDTHDYGASKGGPIDNTAWSLLSGYAFGGHKVSVGYQMIDGDEPFDWVAFEGTQSGALYLGNAGAVVPFSEPNERSWQLRYDLNMAAYGVPGLSFMARYIRGDGMDNSNSRNPYYTRIGQYDEDADSNKEWERNLEVGYVVQSGQAKDLSLRIRQSTHRSSSGTRWPDHDEVRVIIEYPLNVF